MRYARANAVKARLAEAARRRLDLDLLPEVVKGPVDVDLTYVLAASKRATADITLDLKGAANECGDAQLEEGAGRARCRNASPRPHRRAHPRHPRGDGSKAPARMRGCRDARRDWRARRRDHARRCAPADGRRDQRQRLAGAPAARRLAGRITRLELRRNGTDGELNLSREAGQCGRRHPSTSRSTV